MAPPEVGTRRYPCPCPPVSYTTTSMCVAVLDAVLQVLLCSIRGGEVEDGGSYIPCEPVYPPEVGYLGSHGLWYPMEPSTELLAYATWCSALPV